MNRRPLGRAPNYTSAALVMGAVNLIWIFIALWVIWGWPAVLLTALAVHRGIDWIARRRTPSRIAVTARHTRD